jgi:hypothetical protein
MEQYGQQDEIVHLELKGWTEDRRTSCLIEKSVLHGLFLHSFREWEGRTMYLIFWLVSGICLLNGNCPIKTPFVTSRIKLPRMAYSSLSLSPYASKLKKTRRENSQYTQRP